jgi:FMN-dependent NADH-azoreductase
MAKLLYIEASPRKDRSSSIRVARAFVDEYRRTHPEDMVDMLDLWGVDLPVFDGETVNTKYAILHGDEKTPEQVAAWRPVEEAIERFTSADKYLFSLPMWNFGIPYKLKHFIDVLIQPTYTFSFTPEPGRRVFPGHRSRGHGFPEVVPGAGPRVHRV